MGELIRQEDGVRTACDALEELFHRDRTTEQDTRQIDSNRTS